MTVRLYNCSAPTDHDLPTATISRPPNPRRLRSGSTSRPRSLSSRRDSPAILRPSRGRVSSCLWTPLDFLSQGPFKPRYKGQQTRHAAVDIHIPSPGDPPPARRRRRTATVTPMPTTSRPRRGARGESCGKALPRVFQQGREAAAASIKDAEFGSLHHEFRPVLDPPAGADCWNSREHSLAAAARS